MDSQLHTLTQLVRYAILTATTAAGSGHPTTSLSAAELMVTLFFKYLHADLDQPSSAANDRVIFSKGHASPLFYALYFAAGKISEEALSKMRTFESNLEGHPTARFAYTEAATGSLGQGLSVGVGEALALKALVASSQKLVAREDSKNLTTNSQLPTPRVYVLLGDGELAEGSVWEAAMSASHYGLGNLIAVADINGLGQSRETMYGHDIEVYAKRFEAFGWRVVRVDDGNDLAQVDSAWTEALKPSGRPTIIVANTKKGKGISFIEDVNGWHGKPLSKEELDKALVELGDVDKTVRGIVAKPVASSQEPVVSKTLTTNYELLTTYDKPTATRKAFGNALVRLGKADPTTVVLDGDVQNSTYTELFAKAFPERFFQMFIAEQNAVSVALGMNKRGATPWFATFAAFFTRAYDQVRMASLSEATLKLCGSHAGVSIGQDGASQMGLEDIAMMRAVHGSTVLYPSDAIATERLVEEMAKVPGISYIRTTRGETPVIYKPDESFPIGGSKVHYASKHPSIQVSAKKMDTGIHGYSDTATIVAAGITLVEALKAQKELASQGVTLRVIDCYSVKPIDTETLKRAATETKGMIVVEDHFPEGGLGEAVLSALGDAKPAKFVHLAVRKTPQSGKPAELLAYEEIDSAAIIAAVRKVIAK